MVKLINYKVLNTTFFLIYFSSLYQLNYVKLITQSLLISNVWFFFKKNLFFKKSGNLNVLYFLCFFFKRHTFLQKWNKTNVSNGKYLFLQNRATPPFRFKLNKSSYMWFKLITFTFLSNLQALYIPSFYKFTNLVPRWKLMHLTRGFHYNNKSFNSAKTVWFLQIGVKFLEFVTGLKVFIYLNRNFVKYLSSTELLICNLWNRRLVFFQRKVGFSLFIIESLHVLYLTLKIKDPEFFINWFKVILGKVNFWKHRNFLKYFRFLLLYVFKPHFKSLKVYGVRFRVKGKISVAGNARKRLFDIRVAKTSYSTLKSRVVYKKDNVSTFTGVLGLKFIIFFC